MQIEITQANNLATITKAIYQERYQYTRRGDGSQVWQDSGSLAGVIARGCVDGFINHTKMANRRVYLLKEDAIKFLDEYVRTRINSNGTTKYTLSDMEVEECYTPKFGRIARWLGVDHLWRVGKDVSCQLLRIQETLDDIKKIWQ